MGARGQLAGSRASEEESQRRDSRGTISFLSKVLIPVGGWGRVRSPPRGVLRVCQASRGPGQGGRGADRPLTWQEVEGKGLAGLQGRGKESGMADPGRERLGEDGAGPDLLRTPEGNGGFPMGVRGRGCQGPFLPGWVGPLDQQPLWQDGRWGRLDPQQLRGEQRSKCSLGTSRGVDAEGERGDVEEERGRRGRWREAWRSRAEQRSGRKEGLTPRGEKGLGTE